MHACFNTIINCYSRKLSRVKTFSNFLTLPPSVNILPANFYAEVPGEHMDGRIPHMCKVKVRVLLHVFVLTWVYSHSALHRHKFTAALYFAPTQPSLPKPDGPLSAAVSSFSIIAANKEVTKVLEEEVIQKDTTSKSKWTKDANALHSRPERGPGSFCSGVGFLRLLISALFPYLFQLHPYLKWSFFKNFST